jgi:hypothetical protein
MDYLPTVWRHTGTDMRQSTAVVWGAYVLAASLALLYDQTVIQHADEDSYKSADGHLTRILLPDALYYRTLFSYVQSGDLDPLSFALQSPNVFLPALAAHGLRYIPGEALLLNLVLLGFAGVLLARLLAMLQIRSVVPLVLFFLNFETLYYTQGIVKELPSTVLVLSFAVALLHQRRGLCLLLVVLALPMRWQLAGMLLAISCLQWIPPKLRFRALHGGLACLCAILPLFYQNVLRGAVISAESYQAEVEGIGMGKTLSSVLRTVPGSGYVILPLRSLQNMLEPFPAGWLIEEGAVNIYIVALSGSLLLMAGCYIVALREGWWLLRGKEDRRFVTPRTQVVLLVTLYVLGTAVNPWIHHRYIYPILPLIGMLPWLRPRTQRMILLYGMATCGIITVYAIGLWWHLSAL